MVFHHLLQGKRHPTAPGAIGRAGVYEWFEKLAFAGRRDAVFRQLARLSGARPGDRVLDVGCGPGVLTEAVARRVGPHGHAVGLDPSEPMIQRARHRHTGNCSFQVGHAEDIDADDGSYDVVVSSFAMHHVSPSAQPRAFAEMHRTLRPGGELLIADFRPPRARFGRYLVGALTGEAMRDNPVEEIGTMARDAGFDAVTTGELRPFTHYTLARKPERECPGQDL